MTLKILQDDEKMTVHVKDFFFKRLKHIGHFVYEFLELSW